MGKKKKKKKVDPRQWAWGYSWAREGGGPPRGNVKKGENLTN